MTYPTGLADRIVQDRLALGENPIRVWRQVRGLTITQLSSLTETSKSFLSQIESGDKRPAVYTLQKIALVLGVSISDLVVPLLSPLEE